MTTTAKKPPRMAAHLLRAVARLAETPGAGKILQRVFALQLGLDVLRQASIPPEVPPYRPLHLGAGSEERRDG